MSKKVDHTLEDAAALLSSINENRAALTEKGMTAEKEALVSGAYDTAKQKNNYQLKAVKLVNEKTIEQNSAFDELLAFIVKIQSAAKAAFGNDKAPLKKFRVGDVQPRTVKSILTWGEYFQGLLLEHGDDLTGNGLLADDMPAFSTCYQKLSGVDSTQESGKNSQQAATTARDEALDKLKIELKKFRSFIKAAFAGDKGMQQKFSAIPEGRTGGGGDVTPPPVA